MFSSPANAILLFIEGNRKSPSPLNVVETINGREAVKESINRRVMTNDDDESATQRTNSHRFVPKRRRRRRRSARRDDRKSSFAATAVQSCSIGETFSDDNNGVDSV